MVLIERVMFSDAPFAHENCRLFVCNRLKLQIWKQLMTDKHNFTFRVRVQELKGQLQSSHSKLFLSISISSMLWSKQVLFSTTFSFRGYYTFLIRSTSRWVWTLIVKRLFKRLFLRHSACLALLWWVTHAYYKTRPDTRQYSRGRLGRSSSEKPLRS